MVRYGIELLYVDDRQPLNIRVNEQDTVDDRTVAEEFCQVLNDILLSRRMPQRHGARLYRVVEVEDDLGSYVGGGLGEALAEG